MTWLLIPLLIINNVYLMLIDWHISIIVQLPPTLNVKSVRGRLTSYGYPDYYRENMNCTYFIERQPGFCHVELEFIDFDVDEDSPRCSRDYLLLEGVRYCGTTLYGRKCMSLITIFTSWCRNSVVSNLIWIFPTVNLAFHNRNEIAISFIADDHSGNRGFDIRYNQLPCYREPGKLSYAEHELVKITHHLTMVFIIYSPDEETQ